jgi:hypothetical protein
MSGRGQFSEPASEEGRAVKFLVNRASQGPVSKKPPCKGAIRGGEAAAWPGEYQWLIELGSLDELVQFLNATGGALGLYVPEEGEDHPVIEILDEDENDEED